MTSENAMRRRRFGESEDPKEFFRTRKLDVSLRTPDRFGRLPVGRIFKSRGNVVYQKTRNTAAQVVIDGLPGMDGFRFEEDELVIPVNWTVAQAKAWLAKNPSS